MTASSAPATRLDRRLGVAGAAVIGTGAMLGAGVFAVWAPAAGAAGTALLAGLAVAALVALLNAVASARLAARIPASGGTYVYAGRLLGRPWGVCAGWCFVAGKLASCAAMALVFGAYLWPDHPRLPALLAVAACALVNHGGITKTLGATAVVLGVVLVTLGLVVAAGLFGGTADAERLADPLAGASAWDVLRAAGFVFFAFAGYARLATLGEEVRDPRRAIPRAVAISFAVVLAVYAAVAVTALAAIGPDALARSAQPLADVVAAGDLAALEPAVRAGAAVACLGVLVSLLAGIGRTAFAMAADGWAPAALARVDPRVRVPRVAGAAAAVVVAALVLLVDLRGAIGFSGVLVLAYYALANAAAARLPAGRMGALRALALVGVGGYLLVAVSLPAGTLLAGAAVLAGGTAALLGGRALRDRRRV